LASGDAITLTGATSLAANSGSLGEVSVLAAGLIGSARLFTGSRRTDYRSGATIAIGGSPVDGESFIPSSVDSAIATRALLLESADSIRLLANLPSSTAVTLRAANTIEIQRLGNNSGDPIDFESPSAPWSVTSIATGQILQRVSIETGGGLRLAGPGAQFETAELSLIAGDALTVDRGEAALRVSTGQLIAGKGSSGKTLTVSAGQGIELGGSTLSAPGGSVSLNAGDNGLIVVAGTGLVSAPTIEARAGTALFLRTDADTVSATLSAANTAGTSNYGAIRVDDIGSVSIVKAGAAGSVLMPVTGNIRLTAASNLTLGDVRTTGVLVTSSGGTVSTGSSQAGIRQSLDSSGDLVIDQALLDSIGATAGASLSFSARGAITLGALNTALSALSIDAGADLLVRSDVPDGLTLSLTAGGSVRIDARTATGGATALSLGTGSLRVVAQGAITGAISGGIPSAAQVDVGGSLELLSMGSGDVRAYNAHTGTTRLQKLLAGRGQVSIDAAGSLELGGFDATRSNEVLLRAAGSITQSTSGFALQAHRLSVAAGGDITLQTAVDQLLVRDTRGAVTIQEVAAGGDLNIIGVEAGPKAVSLSSSAGALRISGPVRTTGLLALNASGDLMAESRGATSPALLDAPTISLTSAGSIRASSYDAAITPARTSLPVAADTMSVSAAGTVDIHQTNETRALTLTALAWGGAFASIQTAGSLTVTGAVTSAGANGQLFLSSSAALTIDALVSAQSISLSAANTLGSTARGSVRAASLELLAGGDAGQPALPLNVMAAQDSTRLTGAIGGSIELIQASGDLLLDQLRVAGSALLVARSGALLGASPQGRLDLKAAAMSLEAGTGIGRSGLAGGLAGALSISAASVNATSNAGDLRIASRSALLIDRSGLSLSGGGSIVVRGDSIIDVAAPITASGIQSLISIQSAGTLTLRPGQLVQARGGSIDLTSAAKDLIQQPNSLIDVSAESGSSSGSPAPSVRLQAGGGITLTRVNAGPGSVVLISQGGSIVDGDIATDDTDLIAKALILQSGASIGGGTASQPDAPTVNALEIAVDQVAAHAVGSLMLTGSNALRVDTLSLAQKVAQPDRIQPLALNATLSGLVSQSGVIGINTVSATGASIRIEAGAAVATRGMASIRLDAAGDQSRVEVAGSVRSESGTIILRAGLSIDLISRMQSANPIQGSVDTWGMLDVTATAGLRVVDEAGRTAPGLLGRASSRGPLNITGAQSVAAGQALAVDLGSPQGTDLAAQPAVRINGTLSLQPGSILDARLTTGIEPSIGDVFLALQVSGGITSRFSDSRGLFGFGDGSSRLSVDAQSQSLTLRAVPRELSSALQILPHAKADADSFGSFFEADYFGTERVYEAGMLLRTADFVSADGLFLLANSNARVRLADGTSADVRRWLIGGSRLDGFVGFNGPARIDTNRDGSLEDESANSSAAGFELSGVAMGLALHVERTATAAPRSWISLDGAAQAARAFNLPLIEASATALTLTANLALSGGAVIDYAGDAVQVGTGRATTASPSAQQRSLTMPGSRGATLGLGGTFQLSVADFFHARGSMAFNTTLQQITLADGSTTQARSLEFGGANLHGFGGVNGPYWRDTNGNGLIDPLDTPDPASVGVALGEVDFGLVLMQASASDSANAGLSWLALKAMGSSAKMVGLPGVTPAASDIAIELSRVIGAGSAVDTDSKVIDFAGIRALAIADGAGGATTIDFDGRRGELTRLASTLTLRLGDFFEVSGSMGFERSIRTLTLADGRSLQAQVVTLGGTGLEGFLGLGPRRVDLNGDGRIDDSLNPDAIGLAVSNVEFGLILASPTAAETAFAGLNWTALKASIGRIDAQVGLPPDLLLRPYSLGVDINIASGSPAESTGTSVLDLARRTVNGVVIDRSITIATGTGRAVTLAHDGQRGELLRATGGVELQIGGFFHAAGTVAIERSSSVFTLADGTTTGRVPVLSIGATGVQAFVGVNGPYRSDTNGDGLVTLTDAPNLASVGLATTQAGFALALATDTAGGPSGGRRWLALEASAGEASLVGVPGLTAATRNLGVAISRVTRADGSSGSDDEVIDFAQSPYTVATGLGTSQSIALDGSRGRQTAAAGEFQLSIGGVVSARGALGVEQSTTTIQLANKQTVAVNTLRIGGSSIEAFVGVAGPLRSDANGDGWIESSDVINPSAQGLALQQAQFALAVMTPRDTTDPRWNGVRWTALEASAGSVGLVGVPDVTLTSSSMELAVNTVSGLQPTQDAASHVADLAARPIAVNIGTPTPRSIDLAGSQGQLLRAAGTAAITAGQFFHASGSVAVETSTQSLTLSDGSRVTHDVLTVGGANLQAFAGTGGGPLIDTNQNGRIDSGDRPAQPGATGFALGGVNFALLSATPRGSASPATTTRVALSATAGTAGIVGLDALALQASDVLVQISLPDQSSGRVIDFSKSSIAIPVGASQSVSFADWGGASEMRRVRLHAKLGLADVFSAEGSLSIEVGPTQLTLADGARIAVSSILIGGSDLSASIGPAGAGMSVSGAGLAMVLASAQTGATNKAGVSLNGASFTTLTLGVENAAIELGSAAGLTATSLTVELNKVAGLSASLDADRHVLDFSSGASLKVPTGPSTAITLNIAGSRGQLLKVGGDLELVIGEQISLSGSAISFEQRRGSVTDTAGAQIDAWLTVVGGSGVTARVATSPDDAAIGIELRQLTFGLVIARAVNDSRSWLSMTGRAQFAGILGTDNMGLTLSGSALALSINTALTTVNGTPNTVPDWRGTRALTLGSSADPVTIDQSADQFSVTGTLSLKLDQVFDLSGSMRIEMRTLDAFAGGTRVPTSALLIGAAGLNASLYDIGLTNVTLGLALLQPAAASNADGRQWLAMRASADKLGLGMSALGLSARGIDMKVSRVALEANLAFGPASGTSPLPVLDLGQSGTTDRRLQVATGASTPNPASVTLDFAAGTGPLIDLALDASVKIGDTVSASGSFGFRRLGERTITLDNGSTIASATVTSIAASSVSVQIGSGAGTALFTGLRLSDASFAMMVVDDNAGSTFVGLNSRASSLSLVGLAGVAVDSSTLALDFNAGFGSRANRAVDFTAGDLDGNGRADGGTPVQLRGATISTLSLRGARAVASGALSFTLRDPAAANTAAPLLKIAGKAQIDVSTSQTGIALFDAQARGEIQGQRLGVTEAAMGIVLESQGFALQMKGRGELPIPCVSGESVSGLLDIRVNRTGKAVDRSFSVNGSTLAVKFSTASAEPAWSMTEFDVSLAGAIGRALLDPAARLIDVRVALQNGAQLPLIGLTLDQILGLSSIASLGDYVGFYLNSRLNPTASPRLAGLPAPNYGARGVPTLLGLKDYLDTNWSRISGISAGLSLAVNQDGLAIRFQGLIDRAGNLPVSLSTGLQAIGLQLDADLVAASKFRIDAALGLIIDWRNTLAARVEIDRLSIAGGLSASNAMLSATLGPFDVSVGNPDPNVKDPAIERASMAIDLAGNFELVNGSLSFKPGSSTLKANLPLYAKIAGSSLTGTQVPRIRIDHALFGAQPLQLITENFDAFADASKFSIDVLLAAAPALVNYIEGLNVDALGLSDVPFLEQSLSALVDLAGTLRRGIIDPLQLVRPGQEWAPVSSKESGIAPTGSASVKRGEALITGSKGQFARSMLGGWVTVDSRTLQITAVSASGDTISVAGVFDQAKSVSYSIASTASRLRSVGDFVNALNDSKLLGANKASYSIETGEVRIPIRASIIAAAKESPIDFQILSAGDLSLSTSARAAIEVKLQADFDLIIDLDAPKTPVSIQGLDLGATLSAGVKDLAVTGRYGFLGLTAGGAGTNSTLQLDLSLGIKPARTGSAPGADRFLLSQLATEALANVNWRATGAAHASIGGLTLSSGGSGFNIGAGLALGIHVQQLFSPGEFKLLVANNFDINDAAARKAAGVTDNAVVAVIPDLGKVLDISRYKFSDLIDALRLGATLLDTTLKDQPFYTQPLPLINQPLSELVGVSKTFLDGVQRAGGTPAAALGEAERVIEEALGIPSDLLNLSLDAARGLLLVDLQIGIEHRDSFDLDLNMAKLWSIANPGQSIPAGLEELLDISGSGKGSYAVGARLVTRLALALPGSPAGTPLVSVEDFNATTNTGTRAELTASINASNLSAVYRLGSEALRITGGRVILDADAKADTTEPAAVRIGLVGGKPVPSSAGALLIDLPVQALIAGVRVPLGSITIDTDPALGSRGLETFVSQLVGISTGAPALRVQLPDLDRLSGFTSTEGANTLLYNLLYDPTTLLDGVDLGLGVIQRGFESQFLSDIPMVGEVLGGAASLIGDLRNNLLRQLRETLSGPGQTVKLARQALFDVFSSLGWLRDYNDDQIINISDIDVAFYDEGGTRLVPWSEGMAIPKLNVDALMFDMNLGGDLLRGGVAFPLNIDVPGFAFKLDGGIEARLGWDVDLAFGLSVRDGLFLGTNPDQTPEIRLTASAWLDGAPTDPNKTVPLEGSAQLLMFGARVRDLDSKPNEPGFQPSSISAGLVLDMQGQTNARLPLRSLIANPLGSFRGDVRVTADLGLGLELSMPGLGFLPKLRGDFNVEWGWKLSDPSLNFPSISIENLRIDLGSMIRDFLLPIAEKVSAVTEPIRAVVDALVTPIKGMEIVLPKDPTLRGVIDTVNQILIAKGVEWAKPINWAFLDAARFALAMPSVIKGLGSTGGELLLGSLRNIGAANYSWEKASDIDLQKLLVSGISATLALPESLSIDISNLAETAQGGRGAVRQSERSGLQFLKYLTDIGNLAKLFNGQGATLFTYELPLLEFEIGFDVELARIPIPEPTLSWISIVIGALGRAKAYVDLAFGYDTYGLTQAFERNNPLLALDGFFVSDFSLPQLDSNGTPIPGTGGVEKKEFGLEVSIGLKGGVSLAGVVTAGVGGSITASIDVDLADIPRAQVKRDASGNVLDNGVTLIGDGKIRGSEVITMLFYKGFNPLNLFDISTAIDFTGFIWGEVGISPFSINFQYDLFKVRLLQLTFNAPKVTPVLGKVVDGVLTLNAGPRATERLYLDNTDHGESWIVSGANGTVDVEFEGAYTRFSNVTRLVVDLGQGNDTLDARALKTVPIEVRGGAGHNTVRVGVAGGTVSALDGSGDIDASASLASVTLMGGAGNDRLVGGKGNDVLVGGEGFDTLAGGDGADILYGSAGIDDITGGPGVDRYVLVAGLGTTRINETDEDEGTLIDLSSTLPSSIASLYGRSDKALSISVPQSFSMARNSALPIRFSGLPFDGESDGLYTVVLSAPDGALTARAASGVSITGTSTTQSVSGTLSALNAYFTSADSVTYRYTSTEPSRELSVYLQRGAVSTQSTIKLQAIQDTAPAAAWRDLAVSPSRMVAIAGGGETDGSIMLSSDGGSSWLPASAAPKGWAWSAVAISADGQTIAAAASGASPGGIAVSVDGGINWTITRAPADAYTSLTLLPDGRVLAADLATREQSRDASGKLVWKSLPGGMRLSEDNRTNSAWANLSLPNLNWRSIAANASGTQLIAAAGSAANQSERGRLMIASPADATTFNWTETTAGLPTTADWSAVASDAEGRVLLAAARNGAIYRADTSSANWTWKPVAPVRDWASITFSNNGRMALAAAAGTQGGLWLSRDGGASWQPLEQMGFATGLDWRDAAFSPDSAQIIALASGQPIVRIAVPPLGASPSLLSVNPLTARATEPTALAFPSDLIFDADSPNLTVTLSAAGGAISLAQGYSLPTSLASTSANGAITLSGPISALNALLAQPALLLTPALNGSPTQILIVADDGQNTTRGTIALLGVNAVKIDARYAAGQLNLIDAKGTSQTVSPPGGLAEILLTPEADRMRITALAQPVLTVTASAGIDQYDYRFGGSLEAGSASSEFRLTGSASALGDDSLALSVPAAAAASAIKPLTLTPGLAIYDTESVRWDPALRELVLIGDDLWIRAGSDATAADLGDVSVVVRARRLTIDGTLTAAKVRLEVTESTTVAGELRSSTAGGVDTGTAPVAKEVTASSANINLASLDQDGVDDALVIAPPATLTTMVLSATPVTAQTVPGGVVGNLYQIDPAGVGAGEISTLTLGSPQRANHLVIDAGSQVLDLPVRLVVDARSAGSETDIDGSIELDALTIYGTRQTTTLHDGTQVRTDEPILIDDAVRVNGSAELNAATQNTAATLRVTGPVVGGTGSSDLLTLKAGGSVTIESGVGDGIAQLGISMPGTRYADGRYESVALIGGSGTGATATITVTAGAVTAVQLGAAGSGYRVGDALRVARSSLGLLESTGGGLELRVNELLTLEGLVIESGADVVLGGRLNVAGDVRVRASGQVSLAGALALSGGGRLIIESASQVTFASALNFGGLAQSGASLSINASNARINFSSGMTANDTRPVGFTGINTLSMTLTGSGTIDQLSLSGPSVSLVNPDGQASRALAAQTVSIQTGSFGWTTNGFATATTQINRFSVAASQDIGSPTDPLPVTGPIDLQSQSGSIYASTSGDAVVSRLRADQGNVSLRANSGHIVFSAGAIVQGQALSLHAPGGALRAEAGSLIKAQSLTINAAGDVGLSTQPLATDIQSLAAQSDTGSINVSERDDLMVAAGRVVRAAGSVSITAGGSLGIAEVEASTGAIGLTSGGSIGGTNGATVSFLKAATIVTLDAASGIGSATEAVKVTGTLDLRARAGDVNILGAAALVVRRAVADVGNLKMSAAVGPLALEAGAVVSGAGIQLASPAGAITAAAGSVIRARSLNLSAQADLGTLTLPIVTEVDRIQAVSVDGSIRVTELDDLIVEPGTPFSAARAVSISTGGALRASRLEATTGPMTLEIGGTVGPTDIASGIALTTAGSITINAGATDSSADRPLMVSGQLNLRVRAGDAYATSLGDLVINGAQADQGNVDLRSQGGHLTLGANAVVEARRIALHAPAGAVDSSAGASLRSHALSVNARDDIGSSSQPIRTDVAQLSAISARGSIDAIIQRDATLQTVLANEGSIHLRATAGNLTLGAAAAVEGRNVHIDAEAGSLKSSAGSLISAQTLVLQTTGDIGLSTQALNTNVSQLSGRSINGSVFISERNDLSIATGTAVRAAGSVSITAGGSLSVSEIEASSGSLSLVSGGSISGADSVSDASLKAGSVISLDAATSLGSAEHPIKAAGTVDLLARAGDINLASPASLYVRRAVAEPGKLNLIATQGALAIEPDAVVNASTVNLNAPSGAITAGAGAVVRAQSLGLAALDSIGEESLPINTDIERVQAVSTRGSIRITERDALVVAVGATFRAAGSVSLTTGGALKVASVEALAGPLTLNVGGTLGPAEAGSTAVLRTAGRLNIDAASSEATPSRPLELSGQPDIRVRQGDLYARSSGNTVLLRLLADQGDVGLLSDSGSLVLAGGSVVSGKSIALHAPTGSVSAAADALIRGNSLSIVAEGDIGNSTRPLPTDVARFHAVSSSGSISIHDRDSVMLDGPTPLRAEKAIDILAGGSIALSSVHAGSGPIRMEANGAIVTLAQGVANHLQTAGSISLQAQGGVGGFGDRALRFEASAIEVSNLANGDVVLGSTGDLQPGPGGIRSSSPNGFIALFSQTGRIQQGLIEAASRRIVMLAGQPTITREMAVSVLTASTWLIDTPSASGQSGTASFGTLASRPAFAAESPLIQQSGLSSIPDAFALSSRAIDLASAQSTPTDTGDRLRRTSTLTAVAARAVSRMEAVILPSAAQMAAPPTTGALLDLALRAMEGDAATIRAAQETLAGAMNRTPQARPAAPAISDPPELRPDSAPATPIEERPAPATPMREGANDAPRFGIADHDSTSES